MDKYEYISAVINTLNSVTVSGAANLNAILGSIQALQKLEKVLSDEDTAKNNPA